MAFINTPIFMQAKRRSILFCLYTALFFCWSYTSSAETLDVGIPDVSFIYSEQPAALEITVKTASSIRLESFLLTAPNRFVIDIFQPVTITKNSLQSDLKIVEKIRIGSHPDKVRVVFDLEAQFKNIHIASSEKSDTGYTYTLIWSKKSPGKVNTITPSTAPSSQPSSSDSKSTDSGSIKQTLRPLEVIHPEPIFEVPVSTPSIPVHAGSRKKIIVPELESRDTVIYDQAEQHNTVATLPITQAPNELISKPLKSNMVVSHATVDPLQAEVSPSTELLYEPSIDIQRLLADDTGIALVSMLDVALLLALLFLLVLLLIHRRRNRRVAIRSQYNLPMDSPETDDPFVILGCTSEDSNEKIKSQYKHLLKVYHRDGLESHDIPEEVRRLSEEHLRKVKQAYQKLRTERGF